MANVHKSQKNIFEKTAIYQTEKKKFFQIFFFQAECAKNRIEALPGTA
jgi:hypothetical protein